MKHRIIGVIVLVALIVIFLPMLFKKQKHEVDMIVQSPPSPNVSEDKLKMPDTKAMNTPLVVGSNSSDENQNSQSNQKAISPVVVAQPQSQQNVKTSSQDNPQSVTTSEPKIAVKPLQSIHKPIFRKIMQVKPKEIAVPKVSYSARRKVAQQLEQAWVIQTGSFTEVARAKALVHKLRKLGFKAFDYQVKTPKGQITRVYVGPVVQKEQAEKLLKKMNHRSNIKGFVVPYKPTKL